MGKKKTKDIQVITGEINTNILLVASHGVKGDDDNVGRLAVAIQKWLGCNAIINEAFKKPTKDKNTGKYEETDIENRKANLNFKPDAEKHPTFIKSLREKITDQATPMFFGFTASMMTI